MLVGAETAAAAAPPGYRRNIVKFGPLRLRLSRRPCKDYK